MSFKSNDALTTKTKVIFTPNDFVATPDSLFKSKEFKIGSNVLQIIIKAYKDIEEYKELLFKIILTSDKSLDVSFDIFTYDSNMKKEYQYLDKVLTYLSQNKNVYNAMSTTQRFKAEEDKIFANKSLIIGALITIKSSDGIKCIERGFGYMKTFNVKEFNDLHIVCGDKEFFVSKAVLTSHSEVFEKMFVNEMKEQKTNQLIIEDIDGKVFEEFLNYIYFGNSDKLDDLKEDLLVIADRYQVLDLKEICGNFIFVEIYDLNAIKILLTFDKYNCIEMLVKTIDFISRNLWEIRRRSPNDWIGLVVGHNRLLGKITERMSEMIKDGLIGDKMIDNFIKSYTFSYITF